MISMYELKLGNEKLEALNFLLESTKDLTAALQELDVSGLKSETAEIKENIAKASALNQSLKELRAHLENNDFSSLLAAYNEAKPRLDGFDAKMSEFDEKYSKIEDAAASLPEIKTKIEQATQLLENALPGLTAKIDEFNQKIADGQTKLEQTSQDFQTKYGELVKLKGELETLKGEINTLLLQGVINDEQTATTTTFSSVKIKSELDALKNQIPDTSNLLTSESAEQTFAKKTDVPNIDGLVTKEDAEKTFAKKDDVSLSLETKLGKNEKASDSAMLEGNSANAFVKIADVSSEASPNKIVKRNEAGDIYAKAVYSEKLNLGSTVEDGALVANSTVLFSENGSELIRKASINKLKELVASESDLSEYVKKTDADKAYLGKNEKAKDSQKLNGIDSSDFVKTSPAQLSQHDSFLSYSQFPLDKNDTSTLYTQLSYMLSYINIPHHFKTGRDAFPENVASDGQINFDEGINFISDRTLTNVTAINHDKIRNRGKSGLISFRGMYGSFSSDFKLLNPDDFITRELVLFSYFISPFDAKIYLQFAGNLK